jgi:hypothetical protein
LIKGKLLGLPFMLSWFACFILGENAIALHENKLIPNTDIK